MAIRYKKYHFFLDLFGLMGLSLAVLYYYDGHTVALKDQELYNLWGNLASEFLGIWLGVRIIDFIIQRQDKQDAARVGIVRSTRFLRSEVSRTIEFAGNLELASLKEELAWSRGILNVRKRFFSPDELSDLSAFYDALSDFIPALGDLVKIKEAYNAGQRTKKELAVEAEKCRTRLPRFEELRWKAERNILEESEEE